MNVCDSQRADRAILLARERATTLSTPRLLTARKWHVLMMRRFNSQIEKEVAEAVLTIIDGELKKRGEEIEE